MRVLKRALAIVYLAAAIVALGTLVCQFWGPYTYRFMLLMRDPMPRIVVTVCGGVVAFGVLASFFRLMFARREPSCVHPAGERNIEVTDALSNIEKRLPDHFLRCHQSYVVNLSYITRIRRFELELTDGTILPVPEKKYTTMKSALSNIQAS